MQLIHTRAFVFLLALSSLAARAAEPNTLLVEAESFRSPGGWMLDTQFVHIMGSPYLIAHGMGKPVPDATTTVKLPAPGQYKVFVRTKDWVARWKAPGQPGRFQLLIDGKPLQATFGTTGPDWHWQDGGLVEITRPEISLALHDLTGFAGRCDAVLFSSDPAFVPPNDLAQLTPWRKKVLGLPDQPKDMGHFDLVVIGGGYGGLGTAISAARMGCKVALIQDRPVLGGNGSSEIRVWSMGGTTLGRYPHLGEIVEEFADSAKSSPGMKEEFGDEKKETIVRAEKNITLFLNTQAFAVEKKDNRITAVLARNTSNSEEYRFTAPLFADCTGHATIGALAGADFNMAEEGHMGMSNMWRWDESDKPEAFPETPWALDLTMKDFPYPNRGKAEWFWEGGFNRHPINDLEYIRDWNFRAIYGAFNAMKNRDGKDKHPRAKLEWVAYVGGNRESRLLLGDVILTREDIINKVDYHDGTVPTTWSIDLHEPKEQFAQKFPEDPFISKAIFDSRVDKKQGYPVPYRCFYSRNISNLFMAGRNISVDRGALGTVRVMRTGGMMGEVVGKAASICIKRNCLPKDVYADYFPDLKELLNLPGRARRATVNDPIDPNAPLPAVESLTRAAPHREKEAPPANAGLDPSRLAGIVIDDTQAKLSEGWSSGTGLKGFVGKHYLYDAKIGSGDIHATFEIKVPAAGRYEVRLGYAAHENRADNVPVAVRSADGEKSATVNQKQPGDKENGFLSLGVFRFDTAAPGAVVITNKGTKGHVSVDAVQVLPAQ